MKITLVCAMQVSVWEKYQDPLKDVSTVLRAGLPHSGQVNHTQKKSLHGNQCVRLGSCMGETCSSHTKSDFWDTCLGRQWSWNCKINQFQTRHTFLPLQEKRAPRQLVPQWELPADWRLKTIGLVVYYGHAFIPLLRVSCKRKEF